MPAHLKLIRELEKWTTWRLSYSEKVLTRLSRHSQVSPDGQWVRRTTPVLDPNELTNRTIYVDGFKSTDTGAMIENAQQAFEEYGSLSRECVLFSYASRPRKSPECQASQALQDEAGLKLNDRISFRFLQSSGSQPIVTLCLTGAVLVEFENENVAREVVEILNLEDDTEVNSAFFPFCLLTSFAFATQVPSLYESRLEKDGKEKYAHCKAHAKWLIDGSSHGNLTVFAEQNKKSKNMPTYIQGAWIRLTDLNPNATKQEISSVFSRYGRVKNVEYHGSNNSAVIFYSTCTSSHDAVKVIPPAASLLLLPLSSARGLRL
eukprot:761789-Hanusia_phi.AAC.2